MQVLTFKELAPKEREVAIQEYRKLLSSMEAKASLSLTENPPSKAKAARENLYLKTLRLRISLLSDDANCTVHLEGSSHQFSEDGSLVA